MNRRRDREIRRNRRYNERKIMRRGGWKKGEMRWRKEANVRRRRNRRWNEIKK